MKTNTDSMHITPSGGNVFLDLGFSEKKAEALKVKSDRIISEKLAAQKAIVEVSPKLPQAEG